MFTDIASHRQTGWRRRCRRYIAGLVKHCTFCAIVAGTSPSEIIYQDDHAIAFMDLLPMTHGHCLVVPRRHVVDIWDLDDDEWSDFLRVNLLGSVRVVRTAAPHLKRSSTPAVVFTASIAGVESLGASIGYESAKAAVIVAAKNLSRSLAEFGIRVNVVAPGNVLFEGGAWADKLAADRAGTLRIIESGVPMRRFGTPEEIAEAVTFLASARADHSSIWLLAVSQGRVPWQVMTTGTAASSSLRTDGT